MKKTERGVNPDPDLENIYIFQYPVIASAAKQSRFRLLRSQ